MSAGRSALTRRRFQALAARVRGAPPVGACVRAEAQTRPGGRVFTVREPWLGPGQFTELMPHLATVEGRIHFAGEHTSPWHGWMQGALESGNRVARGVDSAA